jgi:hypothetical protein
VTTPLLNDADIPNSAELWRRIVAIWWVWDEKLGGRRISSQAFENSKDGSGTSVVLVAESSVEEVLSGHAGYGLAVLTVGAAREANQGVRRVPLQDVPGHAQIEGRKSASVKRQLVAACRLIVEPTPALQ